MPAQLKWLQLNQCIDRILNAPGNQVKPGMMLEMAIVLDESCDKEYLLELSKGLAASLKNHSKVFQNVRCNIVRWGEEDDIETEVMPLAFVQLGKAVPRACSGQTKFDCLASYLKLYHARCRCVLVLTRGDYIVDNLAACMESMNPFLKRRLLLVREEKVIQYEYFRA